MIKFEHILNMSQHLKQISIHHKINVLRSHGDKILVLKVVYDQTDIKTLFNLFQRTNNVCLRYFYKF